MTMVEKSEHERRSQAECRQNQGKRRVPDALAGSVGAAAPPDHDHRGEGKGNGVQQAGLQIGEAIGFDDLRLPELQTAADGRASGQGDAEQEHIPIPQNLPDGLAREPPGMRFNGEGVDQPVALLAIEPVCLRRPIGEHDETRETQQNCGSALENEHPLPAPQTKQAIDSKQSR